MNTWVDFDEDLREESVDMVPESVNDSELNDPWSTAREASSFDVVPDSSYDSDLNGEAWSLARDTSLVEIFPELSKDGNFNDPLSSIFDITFANLAELELERELEQARDNSKETPREIAIDRTHASEDTEHNECKSAISTAYLLCYLLNDCKSFNHHLYLL